MLLMERLRDTWRRAGQQVLASPATPALRETPSSASQAVARLKADPVRRPVS